VATYAVGDIQGCLPALEHLLASAHFTPDLDTLWVAGDLVNRGPDSLGTLRFIKSLPNCQVVLGNHDLHLLAVAGGHKAPGKKDTLNEILKADDSDTLLSWLQCQALMHHDPALGYAMVHAGIPPCWTLEAASGYAREVEAVLQSSEADLFFSHMYGNTPCGWHDHLEGTDRWRVITNYFTRMRFCDHKGQLELVTKTDAQFAPEGFSPWFSYPRPYDQNNRILFGHWASIEGRTNNDNIIALDTGCVWGGSLTMIRLEDRQLFSEPCPLPPSSG